VVGVVVWLILY